MKKYISFAKNSLDRYTTKYPGRVVGEASSVTEAIKLANRHGATVLVDGNTPHGPFLEAGVEFAHTSKKNVNSLRMRLHKRIMDKQSAYTQKITAKKKVTALKNGKVFGTANPEVLAKVLQAEGHKKANVVSAEARGRLADEYVAKVAPRAIQLRKMGHTFEQIAGIMHDEGYTTRRGRPLRANSVLKILKRFQGDDFEHTYDV